MAKIVLRTIPQVFSIQPKEVNKIIINRVPNTHMMVVETILAKTLP
jgi:hypothetical protein